MMRLGMMTALAFSLGLSACGSGTESSDDALVTLPEGSQSASQGAPEAAQPGVASNNTIQAVTPEGSRLEPLLSSLLADRGLDKAACLFAPAKGALPVLVFARSGAPAIISINGQVRDLAAEGTVGQAGGRFAGDGITASVRIAASLPAGSGGPATLDLADADGPPFTYKDGYYECR